MPRASDVERRRLNDCFAELCAVRSVFGEEREIADLVTRLLTAVGAEVDEDDTAPLTGAGSGNLLVHLPGSGARTVLLCAHLDTVPHDGVVEPICEDGGWVSAGDTILGADNKASVAVLIEVARRWAVAGLPCGVELLFTASEENALAGAKAFDCSRLRSDFGYVFDHASPIGEVIMASPTYHRIDASFTGRAAHAGISPEDGRSAIIAAAQAIVAMPSGRIDAETTANIGNIRGGSPGTNIVPAHCSFTAEARSLDDVKVETVVAQIVDACHDAANEPRCSSDVDVDVQRLFAGYRRTGTQPSVVAAEAALRACGYEPKRVVSGGGSDANAFESQGFHCTNLANGTQHPHEWTERVSVVALEGMLEVVHALLEELAG
jgi:tripeptide aminopeptidase